MSHLQPPTLDCTSTSTADLSSETLTCVCRHPRPADAQREPERESVFDELNDNQCRVLVSTRGFKVEAMCARFAKTFEIGHKELMGKNITTILGPEPNMQAWNRLTSAAELGIAREHRIRTYSMEGRIMSTVFAALPFSDQRGEVTHILLTLTTLKKECAQNCACYRDFRDPEVMGALVSVVSDPKRSLEALKSAMAALHRLSLDSKGIETLQAENVFSALAQLVLSDLTQHGAKDVSLLALEFLKSVALEKASVLSHVDTIGPILALASKPEHDGTRYQLAALEIIQSLSWDKSCVQLMLHSDTDVVCLLTVVQQRLKQNFFLRHVYVVGQALEQMRGTGKQSRSRLKKSPNLVTVCEDTFGVGMARGDRTSTPVLENRDTRARNLTSSDGRPSTRSAGSRKRSKEKGTRHSTSCANDTGWMSEALEAAPTKEETREQRAARRSQRAAQLAEAFVTETRDRQGAEQTNGAEDDHRKNSDAGHHQEDNAVSQRRLSQASTDCRRRSTDSPLGPSPQLAAAKFAWEVPPGSGAKS